MRLDRYPDITYDAMPPQVADLEELRMLRKWEVALGYRIFAAMRWGQLGDGHVTARDPILTSELVFTICKSADSPNLIFNSSFVGRKRVV